MRQRFAGTPTEVADFGDEIRRVLLELGRTFGAEPLSGHCDTARAGAHVVDGALHITLPKIADRRGRAIAITIQPGSPSE